MVESVAENLQLDWPSPPASRSLGAREVHIWAAGLQPAVETLAALELTLSPDEHSRAQKYIFERDRIRFIAARGVLRAILGDYLHQKPDQIRFTYTERGKPSIVGLPGSEQLHFNLSHSDNLAVFAFSRECAIGIDVEHLRPLKDFEGIAERFFSERETAQLKSLPPSQIQTGFFNLWTRKEAWLKATGEGICDRLAQVEVSMLPGEPARLLNLFHDPGAAAKWRLYDLQPAAGFKAALAVPRADLQIQCWSWRDEFNLQST